MTVGDVLISCFGHLFDQGRTTYARRDPSERALGHAADATFSRSSIVRASSAPKARSNSPTVR